MSIASKIENVCNNSQISNDDNSHDINDNYTNNDQETSAKITNSAETVKSTASEINGGKENSE